MCVASPDCGAHGTRSLPKTLAASGLTEGLCCHRWAKTAFRGASSHPQARGDSRIGAQRTVLRHLSITERTDGLLWCTWTTQQLYKRYPTGTGRYIWCARQSLTVSYEPCALVRSNSIRSRCCGTESYTIISTSIVMPMIQADITYTRAR